MVSSWVGRALQTPRKDREMQSLHLRSLLLKLVIIAGQTARSKHESQDVRKTVHRCWSGTSGLWTDYGHFSEYWVRSSGKSGARE
jgi:hypothetical protein